MTLLRATLAAVVALISSAAFAAEYPAPKQGDWIAKDFKFHSGEMMPALRLHYTTVGEPTGQPVLVLHGSGGSAASMLTPAFAGELFGAGQPLDASKYYIIIPDGIGMPAASSTLRIEAFGCSLSTGIMSSIAASMPAVAALQRASTLLLPV